MSRANGELRAFYDALHEKSDLRFPLADYRRFHAFLPLMPGSSILDVGCGKGFFLNSAGENIRGAGLDFSRTALAAARKAGLKRLFKGEAERLPFRGEAFDFVANIGSLEHFPDRETAVMEMRRVVKRDGKIMIILPNGYDLKTIWKAFRTGRGNDQDGQEETVFMAYGDWRAFLEKCGLAVERVVKYNGFETLDWHYARKDPNVVTATEKVVRRLLTLFLRPVIPLNLSNYFIFICNPGKRR